MLPTPRPPFVAILSLGLISAAARGADAPRGVTTSLFNGKDLNGWVVTGCEAVVDDGNLLLKSGNGFIRSELRYRDFVLEIDWRTLKKDDFDSGIYFRAEKPPTRRDWPTRYQANLQQGHEGDVGGLPGASGGSKLTKPGEWNHFKLTAVGHTAELEINGKPAWKVDNVEATDGYIGLQSEVPLGGQFEFRNIKVTELGYKSLFNGKDLTGWEGGGDDAAKCWSVEDGVLLCTGKKGPWLKSTEQYDDFDLRLQYKLDAGGNSGVYVRVPAGGAHRGAETGEKEAGTEIQLLDDVDKQYANLKPYQYCGSVYAIAPAAKRVGRPAGQWNTIEINCLGNHYQVTHNGVLIVDAAEKQFPELKNRLAKGFLGLQNHSTKVWFREVRIGPAVKP